MLSDLRFQIADFRFRQITQILNLKFEILNPLVRKDEKDDSRVAQLTTSFAFHHGARPLQNANDV
jgi:hypothetical protein